jgi:hypothetical protein
MKRMHKHAGLNTFEFKAVNANSATTTTSTWNWRLRN